MEQLTETIIENAEFSEGQTKTISIRLAGYVTEVVFRASLRVDRTTAGDDVEDGILRMIRGLKFAASNVLDWYTIRDGREGYYLAFLKSQGLVYNADMPAAGDSGTVECQFAFHPGVMPGNQFDLTRCVPLRSKSNVQIEVTWGTASTHLGTGWSIDGDHAGTTGLTVEVSRLVLEKGESEAEAFRPLDHIFVPRLLPVTYPIDNTYDAFSFSQDVLTGAYIRDVMLLILDKSDNKSNGEVTQFRLRSNKGELKHIRRDWTAYTREVRRRYYLDSLVKGLGIIDFRSVKGKDYGLDMVQASKGDWMLEFTTDATDGEIRALYEGADLVSVDPTEIGG